MYYFGIKKKHAYIANAKPGGLVFIRGATGGHPLGAVFSTNSKLSNFGEE